MRLIFEFVTLTAIVLIALLAPPTKSTRLGRAKHWYLFLAQRPWLAILLIGATVFAVEAGFGSLVQEPLAANMDEFSYLLAGDTFAQGRLTNPPHSLWEHFESYNIIQQPTYQSKYPPGQGLVLAFGQSCFGDPAVGVWLNLAVACAAVCWMLYGWLPPRWALLGAILAVLNVSLLRHWGQSYWGGGVALLGGALVFGSLPRIQRDPRLVHGLLIGIGLSLLANSRPYESLIAILPAAAWFGWQLFSPRCPPGAERGSARAASRRGLLLRRVVAPAALLLLLTASWMALYNYRVTRDPLRLPYQVWQDTYTTYDSVADLVFFWRTRTIPEVEPQRRLRKPVSEPLWEIWFERQANLGRKLFWQWQFYVTLTLTLPLLAVPWACRRGWPRFAAVTVGLVIVAIVIQGTHGHAHYAAPVACLISLLLVQGLRWWRGWRRNGRPAGVFLVRAMLALHVFSVVFVQGAQWVSQPLMPHQRWALNRQRVADHLHKAGGQHVVIVQYPEADCRDAIWEEWVYNSADIDSQAVVWARDLGADRNRRLQDYFGQREIWFLQVDGLRMSPLTETDQPPANATAQSQMR